MMMMFRCSMDSDDDNCDDDEEGAGDDSNGDEEDGDDVSPRRNCFQSFEANLSKQFWPPRDQDGF